MRFNCSLSLPRDVRMVPVARHFCENAMAEFGVTKPCTAEVALALTEACANVVEHSDASNEFDIEIELDEKTCLIRVVDNGSGFDTAVTMPAAAPDPLAARGRGMFLMQALVDRIEFESQPEQGTVVKLVKQLEFGPSAPGDPEAEPA